MLTSYASLIESIDSIDIEIVIPEKPKNPFKGNKFVFSGGLHSYTREEAQTMVEAYGGIVSGSVSTKTNYVVCPDDISGITNKIEAARKKGVAILYESAFLAMIQEAKVSSI